MRDQIRYAIWAGNPLGTPEDLKLCIEPVNSLGFMRGMVSKQCMKPRGKGLDGLYCGTHAKRRPSTGVW